MLVEQNSRTVFGLAYRLTGNAHDAEEVVQETFLRVFRKIDSYRAEARATAVLEEVYASTSDTELKQVILQGYMMAGDSDRLLRAARDEDDEDLRRGAIRGLAMSGASDGLWQLYEEESSVEVKSVILQSMFMSGDSARLLELVRTETDPELRRAGIHGLAMMSEYTELTGAGADGITSVLVEVYWEEAQLELDGGGGRDRTLRQAVVHGLSMRGEAEALITLFEQETDPELRMQIVQVLSTMQSDVAVEFLIQLIEQ